MRLELEQSDEPPIDLGRPDPRGLYTPDLCCSLAALPLSLRSEWEPRIFANLFLIDLEPALDVPDARTLFERGLREGETGCCAGSTVCREGTE